MKRAFTFLNLSFLLIFLIAFNDLQGQGAYRVFESNPNHSVGSNTRFLGDANGRLIYLDNFNDTLRVWVSDGTEAGSIPVVPSGQNSVAYLFKDGSDFYFKENREGDIVVSKFNSANTSLDEKYRTSDNFSRFIVFQGNFYFLRESDISFGGDDIVKYDVTLGTEEILFSSDFGGIRGMVSNDNQIYFIASMDDGKMIGKSDGTKANTLVYHKLYDAGSEFSQNTLMRAVEDKIFFFYNPNNDPFDLWVTDGFSAGTQKLDSYFNDNFPPGATSIINNKFIYAVSKAFGAKPDLFVSDGTPSGTLRINPTSRSFDAEQLTLFNNHVYFIEFDWSYGVNRTDGTLAGTEAFIGAYDHQNGHVGNIIEIEPYNGKLVMNAYRPETGNELYVTDGTLEGIELLAETSEGDVSGSPFSLTPVGDKLFFTARKDGIRDIWVFDPDLFVPDCSTLLLESNGITPVDHDTLGTITVSAIGGYGNHTFYLDSTNFNQTGFFDSLSAGIYDITVIDSIGCETTIQLEVGTCDSIYIRDTTITDANEITRGKITLRADGGTPPYQYSLNNGVFSLQLTFINLNPGMHNIRVKDGLGCIFQFDFNIDLIVNTIDLAILEDIQVFPNPVSDNQPIKILATLKDASIVNPQFQLFSLDGRLIKSGMLSRHGNTLTEEININDLQEGNYFFQILNQEKIIASIQIIKS